MKSYGKKLKLLITKTQKRGPGQARPVPELPLGQKIAQDRQLISRWIYKAGYTNNI